MQVIPAHIREYDLALTALLAGAEVKIIVKIIVNLVNLSSLLA